MKFSMRMLLLVFPALAFPAPSVLAGQDRCPDPATLRTGLQGPLADVRYLADDALAGRKVGSPGAACAASYLASRFEQVGLQPVGPAGDYFQSFTVTMGSELGPANRLTVAGVTYTPGEDWIPYGFSGSGEASGTLLYGGFGMRGAILVIDAPDPGSPQAESMEGDPHFIASAAARHGTAAVLVLLGPDSPLPVPSSEGRPTLPIPVLAVSGQAAEGVRNAAAQTASSTIATDVHPATREARNVVGLLPGSDAVLGNEVVIVGAHFDHLGLGGDGSLAPDELGQVHNGADDNASGTAALLEVAGRLEASPDPPSRSVLFIAFTGEEEGLWGSAQYVKSPLIPLEWTVAMVNLDMVGRLGEGPLTVFGIGTATELDGIVREADASLVDPLPLSLLPDGFGPSDHSSFYGEGIPVLHFFTNAHEDYHRPSDDWQKIDERGLARVSELVIATVRRLAGSGGTAVALTPIEGAGNPHGATVGPSSGDPGQSGGYGPYLGTIPDMTPQDTGVRLTGVREGSPAQAAGIQAGDVVVEFDGREITDLYAYTYALRDHEPGDVVTIVVLRDGERVEVSAELGHRR